MAMDIDLIWGSGEANYFLNEDWTGQITLKAFRKLVFARRAFSTKPLCRKADRYAFFGVVGQIGRRPATISQDIVPTNAGSYSPGVRD
jgi:hypothetical protein